MKEPIVNQPQFSTQGYAIVEWQKDRPGAWAIIEYVHYHYEGQLRARLNQLAAEGRDCIALMLYDATIDAMQDLWLHRQKEGPGCFAEKEW